MKSISRSRQLSFLVAGLAFVFLTGCETPESRPAGVSRFISFSVTPLYPKGYEIVAVSMHSIFVHFSFEELKTAWQKKALLIANGRRFKASPLVAHGNESDIEGVPSQSRSVTGTITLTD